MKSVVALALTLLYLFQFSHSQNIFENVIPKKDMDEYGLALEAVFGIGIRLQALLDGSSTPNFVVSPISATLIIGQLLLGAEGEFADQLYELLSLHGRPQRFNLQLFNRNKVNETHVLSHAHFHLQLSSLLKKLQKRKIEERFTLNQNSALFYNKDIELRSFFKNNLIRFYDSEVMALDFSKDTSSLINQWASFHTNGLINTILPGPPGPSTSSIFLNSIYFKAEWETQFSDMLNQVDEFHVNENTNVEITYMQGFIQSILYAETQDYRMISLPYKNKELAMYILFPTANNTHKYNTKEFIKQINPVEVLNTISTAPIRDVAVKIPKLSLSKSLRLLEPLQKYSEFKNNAINQSDTKGESNILTKIEKTVEIYKNFTPSGTADIYLSAAAKNRNLLVSDILQEIVFSINEEGTEAGAVTAGITDYMGGSKTVVLNRPFTFFVRHEPTLATIFWGSITDPSQS